MTSTITFSGVESNKFDGDKTINGNLILQNGADRSIYIANAATATAGDDLTVRAGDGTGTGNRNGGDLYLHGGDAANSGTDGDVILAFVNGGAARGYVGVRMVPSVTLDLTGDANLGDDSIRFAHSRSDGGIRLDNNSVDGVEWYIDSTGTGSGYGTGKLAIVAGIGGTNVLTLASTAVVVGGTTAYADNGEFLEVNKSADDGGIGLFCWSATDAERALIEFHKSASATIGTKALVANGEALGGIVWRAADSATGWSTAASIEGYIDAAPGDNDTGGRLVISTTADGAATPTEAMRINSLRQLLIGHTVALDDASPLEMYNTAAANSTFLRLATFSATAARLPGISTYRSKNNTKGSHTIVANGDEILRIDAYASDGATWGQVAQFSYEIDGTPGSGDTPGRAVFKTTPDGSAASIEALRLDSTQMARFLAGNVKIANATDGGTAGLHIRSKRAISAAMSGATVNLATQIPSGAMILGAQFNVDTAITGATSWSAAFNTGSTTSLGSGYALTQNTKVNQLVVPEIASAATDITITAAGSNFSAGVIEAIVYFIDNTSMANA